MAVIKLVVGNHYLLFRRMGGDTRPVYRCYSIDRYGEERDKALAERHDARLVRFILAKYRPGGSHDEAVDDHVLLPIMSNLRAGIQRVGRKGTDKYVMWSFRTLEGEGAFARDYAQTARRVLLVWIVGRHLDEDLLPHLEARLPTYEQYRAELDRPHWRDLLSDDQRNLLREQLDRAFGVGLRITRNRCNLPLLPNLTMGIKPNRSRGNAYYRWGLFLSAKGTISRNFTNDLAGAIHEFVKHPNNIHGLTYEAIVATLPSKAQVLQYLDEMATPRYRLTRSEVVQLRRDLMSGYHPDTLRR